MGLAAADVGLVDKIDDAAMAGIKAGVAFLAPQVERVNREITIPGCGYERVGGVVQGVRIGVGALNLQAVEIAFRQLDLQAVVPGMPAAFIEERVLECVVVHGVEGQNSVFSAEEKIAELQSGFAAAKRVCGIGAESL